MKYEYGIALKGELHRTGYTREQALIWLADWLAMGARPDVISIIRRPISDWITYEAYSPDEVLDHTGKDFGDYGMWTMNKNVTILPAPYGEFKDDL